MRDCSITHHHHYTRASKWLTKINFDNKCVEQKAGRTTNNNNKQQNHKRGRKLTRCVLHKSTTCVCEAYLQYNYAQLY